MLPVAVTVMGRQLKATHGLMVVKGKVIDSNLHCLVCPEKRLLIKHCHE